MGRTDKYHQPNSNRYKWIIGILVVVIVLLAGTVVAVVYMGDGGSQVAEKQSISSSTLATTKTTVTESSIVTSSKESTTQSTTEETSEKNPYAGISVADLTTQQRAALILLGAPEGWKFNGMPSAVTHDKSVQEIAESDTNKITLRQVYTALAPDTSSTDQMFGAIGNDVNGIGGAYLDTYAFGRDGSDIYYYVVTYSDPGNGNPQAHTKSFGVKNIDTIWKTYVDRNEVDVVNRIADRISLE